MSIYYGIDLTKLEVTPMGAFTLKCIELQKDNIKVSLATKFYTCSMDTMVATIYTCATSTNLKLCYKYVTLVDLKHKPCTFFVQQNDQL
jgi:hypothetical protein